jgi:CRP/FNR family cyclic AMP-dependent transcriptional regulator
MALTREALGRVPLFADLKPKELTRLLKSFKERTFEAGESVMAQGSPGTAFYVIEAGTAVITRTGKEVVRLGPGDFFGEIALIDGGDRTATVSAATELRCHGLAAWDFRGIVESDGRIAWALVEALTRRLREAEASD